MTNETKHLLYWWGEWFKRLLLTSYHLTNRKAYRNWKLRSKNKFEEDACRELFPDLDGAEENDLF